MKLKLKDLKEIKNEEMRNVKIIKELHLKKKKKNRDHLTEKSILRTLYFTLHCYLS